MGKVNSTNSENIGCFLLPKAVGKSVSAFGRTVSSTEGLDKLSKFGDSIIGAMKYSFGNVFPSLNILSVQLKTYSDFVGALNIFSRAKEWICDKHPVRWTAPWYKRVFLTLGNAFETVKYGHTVGLWSLGRWAATSFSTPYLRFIPGVGMCKDAFISISSFFAIYDNRGKYQQLRTARETKQIDNHLKKWTVAKYLLNADNRNNPDAVQSLKEYYIESKKAIAAAKGPEGLSDKDIESKWVRLFENTSSQVLNSAVLQGKAETYCNYKLKKWSIESKNNANNTFKAKISIINDLFKLTMISLVYTAAFITAGALVQFAFVAFGLGTGYSGYRKFLHESKYKENIAIPERVFAKNTFSLTRGIVA